MNPAISFEEFKLQLEQNNSSNRTNLNIASQCTEKANDNKKSIMIMKQKNAVEMNKIKDYKPVLSTAHQPANKIIAKAYKPCFHDINKKQSKITSVFSDTKTLPLPRSKTKEDYLEYQQKTVSRLIDKRREYKEKEKHGHISEKKINSDVRIKRKERIKSKKP